MCFLINPGQQGASQANGEGEPLYHEVEGHYSESLLGISLFVCEEVTRDKGYGARLITIDCPSKVWGHLALFFFLF